MNQKLIETYWSRIYIAGDFNKARDVCRNFCFVKGLCVNVTKNNYIYTGGEETGVIVEIINYPRYPLTKEEIDESTYDLGLKLRDQLCQDSFTVVNPDNTFWISSRSDI